MVAVGCKPSTVNDYITKNAGLGCLCVKILAIHDKKRTNNQLEQYCNPSGAEGSRLKDQG